MVANDVGGDIWLVRLPLMVCGENRRGGRGEAGEELRAAFSTVAARVSPRSTQRTHVPIATDANTPPFAAESAFEPSHIMLSLLE